LLRSHDMRSERTKLVRSLARSTKISRILGAKEIRHVPLKVKHNWVWLLWERPTGSEPVDFFVWFKHHHAVRIPRSYLSHFLVILFVDMQRSWRKLAIEMIMAKLTFVTWAPGVDLSQWRSRNSVSEAAFDSVDSLADVSEALDKLWELGRVNVTKSKLSVRVIFSERVDKALVRQKESKVVPTANLQNFCLFTEWHSYRGALLDAILNKRPCESFSELGTGHIKVSASCDIIDFNIWFT